MSLLSNIRISLYRGLVGLVIGSIGGGIVGAVVMWLISRQRENPEEPAWIFAGTVFGLAFGVFAGSVAGFIAGLVSFRSSVSGEPMLKSTRGENTR